MRIDPMRVSPNGEVRKVSERTGAPRQLNSGTPVEDTADLLAISSGVRVARERDVLLDQLREAYQSGALRPDPQRIAERLMQWGFDSPGGDVL